ncbi:hypothetical protein BD779DRAFT_243077 [Infundibulicybe gibba]|nr:hypothetical protein BD779DRAFT_243077 [Infundibulicybe gibba]
MPSRSSLLITVCYTAVLVSLCPLSHFHSSPYPRCGSSTPLRASSRPHPASKPACVCSCHGHACQIPGPVATHHVTSQLAPLARPSSVQHPYEYCHVHQPRV